jgi:RimJ/RimL family protein N-acetyltransferase
MSTTRAAWWLASMIRQPWESLISWRCGCIPPFAVLGGGDALVEAVVDWARTEGASVVRLQVMEDNRRARRFYERNGFRLTGQTRLREKDGAVELQMERPT